MLVEPPWSQSEMTHFRGRHPKTGRAGKKLGVIYSAVYRSVDNANDVTVIHDFHSLEKAKVFAASPELKAAMEKAGVKGTPQIWITTKSMK